MTKERQILFNGPMVRAVLDGSKTQTRRIMKPQPDDDGKVTVGEIGTSRGVAYVGNSTSGGIVTRVPCPYGQPGDRLWIRESGWERPERTPKMMREGADTWPRFAYAADDWNDQDRADFKAWGFKPRPSIHMPRWASRILLEITGVRVERLQDISEDDAKAEGAEWKGPRMSNKQNQCIFRQIWTSLNGPDSWEANPYVWVIEFKMLTP